MQRPPGAAPGIAQHPACSGYVWAQWRYQSPRAGPPAGDAARPFLVSNEKKMNLNITISTSPLGQQGMRGSEPFYIKGQGRVDNLGDDED